MAAADGWSAGLGPCRGVLLAPPVANDSPQHPPAGAPRQVPLERTAVVKALRFSATRHSKLQFFGDASSCSLGNFLDCSHESFGMNLQFYLADYSPDFGEISPLDIFLD